MAFMVLEKPCKQGNQAFEQRQLGGQRLTHSSLTGSLELQLCGFAWYADVATTPKLGAGDCGTQQ